MNGLHRLSLSRLHHEQNRLLTWIAARCGVPNFSFIVTAHGRGLVFVVGLSTGTRACMPLTMYLAEFGRPPCVGDIETVAAG